MLNHICSYPGLSRTRGWFRLATAVVTAWARFLRGTRSSYSPSICSRAESFFRQGIVPVQMQEITFPTSVGYLTTSTCKWCKCEQLFIRGNKLSKFGFVMETWTVIMSNVLELPKISFYVLHKCLPFCDNFSQLSLQLQVQFTLELFPRSIFGPGSIIWIPSAVTIVESVWHLGKIHK